HLVPFSPGRPCVGSGRCSSECRLPLDICHGIGHEVPKHDKGGVLSSTPPLYVEETLEVECHVDLVAAEGLGAQTDVLQLLGVGNVEGDLYALRRSGVDVDAHPAVQVRG